MKSRIIILAFSFLMLCSKNGLADQITVPIDYALIRNILVDQLYTAPNTSAHLWGDNRGCSYLDLSDPQIDGQQGLVRIINHVHARLGTAMNGNCMTLLEWTGKLETFQQPRLNAEGTVLSFPVTQAIAYDSSGRNLTINQLQDLITRFAEPRLASVKIDLNETRHDIEKTLDQFVSASNKPQIQSLLDSLKFSDVKAKDSGLIVNMGFELPVQPKNIKTEKSPAPAFTEREMKQWRATWQEWDTFLTDAINQATADSQSEEARETLLDILLDARVAFQAGLTSQNGSGKDPVRVFFNTTWDRLGPVLRTISRELPGAEGLRYLTFIAATDVLYQLETLSPPLGLDISSEGLRRLGRLLIAKRQEPAS